MLPQPIDWGSPLTSRQKKDGEYTILRTKDDLPHLLSQLVLEAVDLPDWCHSSDIFVPATPGRPPHHDYVLAPMPVPDTTSVLLLAPHRSRLWSNEETSTLYLLSPPFLCNELSFLWP